MATLPIPTDSPQSVLKIDHRPCPHCGSRDVHRSHSRGIIERRILRMLHFYPLRCDYCDRRFYVWAFQ